jgi:hypothetical protein
MILVDLLEGVADERHKINISWIIKWKEHCPFIVKV